MKAQSNAYNDEGTFDTETEHGGDESDLLALTNGNGEAENGTPPEEHTQLEKTHETPVITIERMTEEVGLCDSKGIE